MSAIWKFKLELIDQQTISLPAFARLLTVQVQNGVPCLWALLNTEQARENRVIRTIGKGRPIDDPNVLDYIGTYQLHGGDLVFHVFEERQ